MRRAETDLWRGDRRGCFRLAEAAGRGGRERVLAHWKKADERPLRNRPGDNDGRGGEDGGLNGRATPLVAVALFMFASVLVRRGTIFVMMRSRRLLLSFGIVVKCAVVPLLLFEGGYGVVIVDGAGMAGAGFFVSGWLVNALQTAASDAGKPEQRARPRESAEDGGYFGLGQSNHFRATDARRPVTSLPFPSSCPWSSRSLVWWHSRKPNHLRISRRCVSPDRACPCQFPQP